MRNRSTAYSWVVAQSPACKASRYASSTCRGVALAEGSGFAGWLQPDRPTAALSTTAAAAAARTACWTRGTC